MVGQGDSVPVFPRESRLDSYIVAGGGAEYPKIDDIWVVYDISEHLCPPYSHRGWHDIF
jgi:hypothetical protein